LKIQHIEALRTNVNSAKRPGRIAPNALPCRRADGTGAQSTECDYTARLVRPVASHSSHTHNGPMFERYSHRARCLIFVAHWSARRRGGSHIEPDDLLHALIREDRGEFAAISAEVFPGAAAGDENATKERQRLFSDGVARALLRELHEDADPLSAETPGDRREPVPYVDMPISRSLKEVLASVAQAHQDDTRTIEPLDLLAGIVKDRDSQLAHILRDHGITHQNVAKALDSGPSGV
jgi:ATP-dependent Clp protease ATP-binding subunit ClpA